MKNVLLMVTGLMLLMPLPALSQSSSDDDRDSSYGRGDRDLEEMLRSLGGDMSGGRQSRGAGFLLRNGDATVAVRCDPRESMKTCVEATTTLLEKVRSAMPPGGGPGTAPGSTPPRP